MAIWIVGAGGLAREVLAVMQAGGQTVTGFLVEPGYSALPMEGLPVCVGIEPAISERDARHIVAIGSERARARIAGRLRADTALSVLHPSAVFGPRVNLEAGAMVIGPCSATVDVTIGRYALINPGCTIAHDCRVGSFASLGPGVALAGSVVVEEGVSIGIGAVVAPSCRIGAWSVVGAGAVVIRDVEPGTTVAGVPARVLARGGNE